MLRATYLVILGMPPLMAGCGLIDSDITRFDLSLPEFQYTIDSAQWGIEADGQFPQIACSEQVNPCMEAARNFCGDTGCAGFCNTESLCQAAVPVALNRNVNVLSEKPELSTIEDQPFIDVTIDNVDYRVSENTFEFDTPVITIYVAPLDVMSPDSPEARPVGRVPPIPAGVKLDWQPLELTPQGQADLKEFMGDYRSTFQIIVGTRVDIRAGDMAPRGRAVVGVRVKAHAGL